MFGLFKKKSQKDILMKKYKTLTEEAYKLSHSNRKLSDAKLAEAEAVLKEVEALEQGEKKA